jgi:C-5 cytosine-specific DNA methylase
MLRSIDLFTGVGGMARALDGIAEPVLYCENDKVRMAVLDRLMASGRLPQAPLHSDICTLEGSIASIDLVAGGWPCVGFSSFGLRKGFLNEESALFFEFVRIVREARPKFVFQENVPNVSATIETIATHLPEYDLVWVTLPAWSVGAPMYRSRWFCLGIRKDVPDGMELPIAKPYDRYDWRIEPVARMSDVHYPGTRFGCLGNALVPDCARLAFMMVFTGFSVTPEELWKASVLRLRRPPVLGKAPLYLKKPRDNKLCGACIEGTFKFWRVPYITRVVPDRVLELIPFAYKSEHQAREEDVLTTKKRIKLWGAPRKNMTGSCRVLTKRSAHDLFTQLRFEKSTCDDDRGGYVNANWVEWLMGFPLDWTLLDDKALYMKNPDLWRKLYAAEKVDK